MKFAVIGLGEAGSNFANDLVQLGIAVAGWDPNLIRQLDGSVVFARNNVDAIRDADVVLSVNYSSESVGIAHEVLPHIKPTQYFCEMNTSSPAKKLEVEAVLKPSGVRFVDLAIMAPVPGKGIRVPMLASGPGARGLVDLLTPYPLSLTYQSDITGEAAERKLLRSIVYKGVAAVICEAMEAGEKMGKIEYIRSQIRHILNSDDQMIDRFVDGSHQHAKRRVEEMKAVKEMLNTHGLSSMMTEGTISNLERYEND